MSSERMSTEPHQVFQVCTIDDEHQVRLSSDLVNLPNPFSHSIRNHTLVPEDAPCINISAIGDRGCGKSIGLCVLAFLLGLPCRFTAAESSSHTTRGAWASHACYYDETKAIRMWDLQGMNVNHPAVEVALVQLACPVSDVVLYFMKGIGRDQLDRLSLAMSTMESMVNAGLRRSMPRVVVMIRDRALFSECPNRLDGDIPSVNWNECQRDESLSPLFRLRQHLSSFSIPEVNLDKMEKRINWTSPNGIQHEKLDTYFTVYSKLVEFLKSPGQQHHYSNARSSESLMLLRETVSWIQQNGTGNDIPWPSIHQVLLQYRGEPERVEYTNNLLGLFRELITPAASCFDESLLSGADDALDHVLTDYRTNSALKLEHNFEQYLVEPNREAWQALVNSFKQVIISARQHHLARLSAAKEAAVAAITALAAGILDTASGAEVNQSFSNVPNLISTFDESVAALSAPAYENLEPISDLFVLDWIGALDAEKVQREKEAILTHANAQWGVIHQRNCSLHLTKRDSKRVTAGQVITRTVDVRGQVGGSYNGNQTQTRHANIGTLLPDVLGADKLPHLMALEVQAHYILENSHSTPSYPCGTTVGVTSLINMKDGGNSWFLHNITYNAATTTVTATLGSDGWGKAQSKHNKQLQYVTIKATPNELFSDPRAAEDYDMGTKPF